MARSLFDSLGLFQYKKYWQRFNAHRKEVVRTTGQWVGLLDQDGDYICDLPPVVSMSAPAVRGDSGSLELTIPVPPGGASSDRVVAELAGVFAFGTFTDSQGHTQISDAATRFIAIERAGLRLVYRVEFVQLVGGGDQPTMMTIHGTGLMKILARFPSVSNPESWPDFTRGWPMAQKQFPAVDGVPVPFKKPRLIYPVKFDNNPAESLVMGAAVDVIADHLSRSFRTVFYAIGYRQSTDPFVVEKIPSDTPSPELVLKVTDKYLWDDVIPAANETGVIIRAHMRFPGDKDDVRYGERPTVVFTVQQAPPLTKTLPPAFDPMSLFASVEEPESSDGTPVGFMEF